jgi:hypothetical protein
MKRLLVIVGFGLLSVACGSSPTSPTATSSSSTAPAPSSILSGRWTGTSEETVAPIQFATFGSVSLTVAQSGASLSGSYTITYADTRYNNSGSLSGTVSGTSISVTLSPSVPTYCQSRVTATHTSPSLTPLYIQGTYVALNCTGAGGGTIILKQG